MNRELDTQPKKKKAERKNLIFTTLLCKCKAKKKKKQSPYVQELFKNVRIQETQNP